MAPDTLERPLPELKDSSLLRQQCYIDGAWYDADSGAVHPVANPATGKRIGGSPVMGAAETKRAIAAASAAWPAWRAKTAKERSAVLRKWSELMLANADDLAFILTSEQGKPLAESKGEVTIGACVRRVVRGGSAACLRRRDPDDRQRPAARRHQGAGRRLRGDHAVELPVVDDHAQGRACARRGMHRRHQAGGGDAFLGAGRWPSSRIARASRRASSTCSRATRRPSAARCARTPTVRKLSFTGSTEVGRLLMKQVAPTIKKLSLELGGNAPFIVFDDADLDAAADGAIVSKYRNAGQTCVCANRLFVHEKVYDAFAAKLADRVRALKVGPGTEAGVTQGPLIDGAALAKVEEHVADATAPGAHASPSAASGMHWAGPSTSPRC